jgi:hypothetical protein
MLRDGANPASSHASHTTERHNEKTKNTPTDVLCSSDRWGGHAGLLPTHKRYSFRARTNANGQTSRK